MSEFERLQKLRLENKKLLERLKVKQGEFGEKAPGKKQNKQKMIPDRHGSIYSSDFQKSCLQSAGEKPTLGSANYADKLLDEENGQRKQFIKGIKKPKSILITPLKVNTKEAGCAAFMSSSKEGLVPPDSLSVRPLLGYDWIAGLLDMDSSLWEKSEQYFSDLHEFRQINQDECVQELLESEKLDISADEHKEDSLSSHLCVYCYRVNKRLFLNPSSESCPICKTKRNQQHRTLGEDAYIRVNFPKSTLLPPYKYKVHRRKSFDAVDSLALIPHCSTGWESSSLCNDTNLSSLDLRTLVEPRPAVRNLHSHSSLELFSRVEDTSRLDHL